MAQVLDEKEKKEIEPTPPTTPFDAAVDKFGSGSPLSRPIVFPNPVGIAKSIGRKFADAGRTHPLTVATDKLQTTLDRRSEKNARKRYNAQKAGED